MSSQTEEDKTNWLPPKKRFKFSVTDQSSGSEEKKQEDQSVLVAGVIRHTSCPDHAVSYVCPNKHVNGFFLGL